MTATYLIMSNGSNKINYLDPRSLTISRTIEVFDEGYQLENLNELEYIKGEIYANIWYTDRVAQDRSCHRKSEWMDRSCRFAHASGANGKS